MPKQATKVKQQRPAKKQSYRASKQYYKKNVSKKVYNNNKKQQQQQQQPKEQPQQQQMVKKPLQKKRVVFNEIVEVGYTHHPMDYDRSSISISQLTKNDILEILYLRRQYQEETQRIQQKYDLAQAKENHVVPQVQQQQQQPVEEKVIGAEKEQEEEKLKTQQQQQQQEQENARMIQREIEFQIYQRQQLEKKYMEHLQYQALQNQLNQYHSTSDVWQSFSDWSQNRASPMVHGNGPNYGTNGMNGNDYFYSNPGGFPYNYHPLGPMNTFLDSMSYLSGKTMNGNDGLGSMTMGNMYYENLPIYSMTPSMTPMEVM